MALGLLGAAMAGGAEAAQSNAKTRIKQMHDDAILRMRQQFATNERVAGEKFSTQERVAGQQFTSGENEANRGHDLTLTQMREQGANSRSAMQIAAGDRRASQGLLTQGMDAEGDAVWFNPVSGDQYQGPKGVRFSSRNDDAPTSADYARSISAIDGEIENLKASAHDSDNDVKGQAIQAEIERLEAQRRRLVNRMPGVEQQTGQPAKGQNDTVNWQDYM